MALDIPLNQSTRILRYHLCSDCWEILQEIGRDRLNHILTISCLTKDCPNRGMVSVQYVEGREREARIWRRNARKYLAKELSWINPLPKRNQAQLLQAMGYY
jgi:hypothetical protein